MTTAKASKEKFGVILTGGSIGQKEAEPKYFDTKEERDAYKKRMNKLFSPGEKSYYKLRYKVTK